MVVIGVLIVSIDVIKNWVLLEKIIIEINVVSRWLNLVVCNKIL